MTVQILLSVSHQVIASMRSHALRERMRCNSCWSGDCSRRRPIPNLVRRVETHRQPLQVVLDPNQRTPSEAVLLNDGLKHFADGTGFSSLQRMLDQLGDREIQRLMVEGGPTTIASFLGQQLVDEFYLIRSDVTHQSPIPSNIDSQRLTLGWFVFDINRNLGRGSR